MSQRRIYVNGRPDWAIEEPARARVSGNFPVASSVHGLSFIGGAIVKGEPGDPRKEQLREAQKRARERRRV